MKKVKISFNMFVPNDFEPGNCSECPFRTIKVDGIRVTELTNDKGKKFKYPENIYTIECNIGFVKECCPMKITNVRNINEQR